MDAAEVGAEAIGGEELRVGDLPEEGGEADRAGLSLTAPLFRLAAAEDGVGLGFRLDFGLGL
jgi:hypothetical protein